MSQVRRVLDALGAGGFDAMLVGAVATFAWGDFRTTRDVDVAVLATHRDASAVAAALAALGTPPDGPFSTAFGPQFIVPFPDGMPFDVFLTGDEAALKRARTVETSAGPLRVISPEDLVVGKVKAAVRFPHERQIDLEDAAAVVQTQGAALDMGMLKSLAKDAGIEAEIDALLDMARPGANS